MAANLAYLSLGSNIAAAQNLPAAVMLLAQHGRVAAVSSVWESLPAGRADQANFLNAALLLETSLSAWELRSGPISDVETSLGRVRTADKNAPRTIDIDIMLFNEEILDIGRRHIPNPEILERTFVAIPLAEIAPDYVHPEEKVSLATIAGRFEPARGMWRRTDVKLW